MKKSNQNGCVNERMHIPDEVDLRSSEKILFRNLKISLLIINNAQLRVYNIISHIEGVRGLKNLMELHLSSNLIKNIPEFPPPCPILLISPLFIISFPTLMRLRI